MLRSIKREFLLNRNSLWQSLALLGGGWLFGLALLLGIVWLADETELVPLGTIFAGLVLVFIGVLYSIYYFACGYEQALTMSCTRRRFLVGIFVTTCLQLLCLIVAVLALSALELGIFRLFFRGYTLDLGPLAPPMLARFAWVPLAAVPAVVCAGMFLGACVQRWGRRALWLLWGLYMIFVLFGDTFRNMAEGANRNTLLGSVVGAAADALARIPDGPMRGVLALVLLVAATVAGLWMLLHGSVRAKA